MNLWFIHLIIILYEEWLKEKLEQYLSYEINHLLENVYNIFEKKNWWNNN